MFFNASHDHQHNPGTHNEDGSGQMRLQQHQNGIYPQNQHIRANTVLKGLHESFLFGNTVGKVHDHRQLGDLRGLKGYDAHLAQPAGGSVLGNAQTGYQHQNQQEKRQSHQQQCVAADPLVVNAAHDHHGRKAQQSEKPLALEVIGRVTGLIVGGGKAGGKQHHQAHHRQ